MTQKRVFTIPTEQDFLCTLVQSIYRGDIFPEHDWSNPALWMDLTLILPTRRAIKKLTKNFNTYLGLESALLPKMICLGEFEDDEDLPENDDDKSVLSLMERKLLLLPLVEKWVGLFQDPSERAPHMTQVMKFIDELLSTLDVLALEHVSPQAMNKPLQGQFDEYWQKSLAFLSIVTEHYPDLLEQAHRVDPKQDYQRRAERFVEKLKAPGQNRFYILAGSTGSVRSTKLMMQALCTAPHGAVVLPHFDLHLDEKTWQAFADEKKQDPRLMAHPMYFMCKFLRESQLLPADVRSLGENIEQLIPEKKLISLAFAPTQTTEEWHKTFLNLKNNIQHDTLAHRYTLIEAAHLDEEALAIACIMRECLERTGQSALVVTSNRMLSMRIQESLRLFGLHVSDSAGVPVHKTRVGQILIALLNLLQKPNAEKLHTFLHLHPLFEGQPLAQASVERLVANVCYGKWWRSWDELMEHLHSLNAEQNTHFLHRAQAKLSEEALLDLKKQVHFMASTLNGFSTTAKPLHLWGKELQTLVDSFCDENFEGYINVCEILGKLHLPDFEKPMDLTQLIGLVDVFLAGETAYDLNEEHPRLKILGPIEARLMHADVVIMAGLNEGDWPAQIEAGAFLNRAVMQALNLSLPERQVGLMAHDFCAGLFAKHVYFTRSQFSDGKPTNLSRFLERLQLVMGDIWTTLQAKGQNWVRLARALTQGASKQMDLALRPFPAPAIQRLKTRFSVSKVEKLAKDKYSYFAQSILQLAPLEMPKDLPDARAFGNLVHKVFADAAHFFCDATSSVEHIQKSIFELFLVNAPAFGFFEHTLKLYEPYMQNLAQWLAHTMANNREHIQKVYVEHEGMLAWEATVGQTLSLSARADRIDVLKDGSVRIIDYKTGSKTSKSDIESLKKRQLLLEAAMALKGGFADLPALRETHIDYLYIKGHKAIEERVGLKSDKATPLALEALQQTQQMLNELFVGGQTFEPSENEKDIAKEYLSLSRFEEWSVADDEGDDEDGGE